MTTTYGCHQLYEAAVLETDWSQMEERIRAAESAIKERLSEFSLNHGGTSEEKQAIVDTLNRLIVQRADVVSWRQSKQAGITQLR